MLFLLHFLPKHCLKRGSKLSLGNCPSYRNFLRYGCLPDRSGFRGKRRKLLQDGHFSNLEILWSKILIEENVASKHVFYGIFFDTICGRNTSPTSSFPAGKGREGYTPPVVGKRWEGEGVYQPNVGVVLCESLPTRKESGI